MEEGVLGKFWNKKEYLYPSTQEPAPSSKMIL
jgi:hypothetical protein